MNKVITFLRHYPIFGLVAASMVVSFLLQLSGEELAANWLIAGVSAVAAARIVLDMAKTLRQGGLGLDILALTAIVVGILLQEYWAAVVIALMLTGGAALEDYAERRATYELTALMDRAPKRAHVVGRDGQTRSVRVTHVAVGNRVLVKPGEVIPVDGVILNGTTSVDESSLTGESLPVTKQPGQQVLSGAINVDAAITIRAVHTSQESQYAQIIQLVKEATSSKSPFVRLADRYSLPFSAVSFGIAFAAWAISGDVRRFLEVIVVATPCPLLIGAPVAIISGMSRAARHGIIIKNGASLERLAAIRAVAFDKTGTLTRGQPTLASIETFGNIAKDELLALAAAIESSSAHILAQAVTAAATKQQVTPTTVSGVREEPGLGMRAQWQSKQVLLGRDTFLRSHNIPLPELPDKPGISTTLLAINGKVAAALNFTDTIRPNTQQTINELKAQGVAHTLMLTGDNPKVAQHIAGQVGITEVHASLLPADKVRVLKEVTSDHRPVGMVGDGINDAPVLAASDVGIALGARGSTAASESADVVIMLDDIHQVAQANAIAKRTLRIGLQSIGVGIGISVGLMLVFATGRFPAVLGATLQEVVDVVVIVNALRAHGSLSRTLFARAVKRK